MVKKRDKRRRKQKKIQRKNLSSPSPMKLFLEVLRESKEKGGGGRDLQEK